MYICEQISIEVKSLVQFPVLQEVETCYKLNEKKKLTLSLHLWYDQMWTEQKLGKKFTDPPSIF